MSDTLEKEKGKQGRTLFLKKNSIILDTIETKLENDVTALVLYTTLLNQIINKKYGFYFR